MAYQLTDRNSLVEPEKMVPVHTLEEVEGSTIMLKPHSFTIICK